jgi:hypothetical protein
MIDIKKDKTVTVRIQILLLPLRPAFRGDLGLAFFSPAGRL